VWRSAGALAIKPQKGPPAPALQILDWKLRCRAAVRLTLTDGGVGCYKHAGEMRTSGVDGARLFAGGEILAYMAARPIEQNCGAVEGRVMGNDLDKC
jgi:hypothetical protein